MQKIKLKKNVYRRYICMLAKKTKTKTKNKKTTSHAVPHTEKLKFRNVSNYLGSLSSHQKPNASVDTKGPDTCLCGDFNTPQEGLCRSRTTCRYYLKGVLISSQPSAVRWFTCTSRKSSLHVTHALTYWPRSQPFERSYRCQKYEIRRAAERIIRTAGDKRAPRRLGNEAIYSRTHVHELAGFFYFIFCKKNFFVFLTHMHTLTVMKRLCIDPALKPSWTATTGPLQTCKCITTTGTVVGKRHSIIDEVWAAVFRHSWSREWPRYRALNTSKRTPHTTAKPGPCVQVCKGDCLELIAAVFPSC